MAKASGAVTTRTEPYAAFKSIVRDRRSRSIGAAAILLVGALLMNLLWRPEPLLLWNVSDSAPRGLYLVHSGSTVGTGDMVVTKLPVEWRGLAARRHYLPGNVPLVKRIAATTGDRICARGPLISVNGIPSVRRRKRDGAGRLLSWWEGCRTLKKDEFFLLMDANPASFDGRYFGVTRRPDVVGRASFIWPA